MDWPTCTDKHSRTTYRTLASSTSYFSHSALRNLKIALALSWMGRLVTLGNGLIDARGGWHAEQSALGNVHYRHALQELVDLMGGSISTAQCIGSIAGWLATDIVGWIAFLGSSMLGRKPSFLGRTFYCSHRYPLCSSLVWMEELQINHTTNGTLLLAHTTLF